MGAFESFLNRVAQSFGGGEEPKPKSPLPPSGKKKFTSEEEIQAANQWARNLLARQNAPQYFVNNAVVARKVGDPVPRFVGDNPMQTPQRATELPFGVGINDVINTSEGYGFFHPQNGNWVQVDPQAIYQKYGAKK